MIAQIPDIAIVLSDVALSSGIDGRQLGKQITTSHPQIRILLMSGYSKGFTEEWPSNLPCLPNLLFSKISACPADHQSRQNMKTGDEREHQKRIVIRG